MKKFKKLVASLLAVLMVLSLTPVTALADGLELRPIHATEQVEEEPAEQPEEETEQALPEEETAAPVAEQAADSENEFIRIFHLDCGRKYFSVSEIEGIIDQLAANYFTHIQLAFGNDGLRFLLDDMSLTVNGTTYSSDKVKSAIKSGNTSLTSGSSGELSESDMDSIIAYAEQKGIKVIPMFNAPGHMYTAVKAMNTLGVGGKSIAVSIITGATDQRTSNYAIDPTDEKAVNYAKALAEKYVQYFAEKGCKMFNMGADESGLNTSNYLSYANLVNDLAIIIKNANMTPLAYNDGIYNSNFTSALGNTEFDTDIVICYWTESGASAADLAAKGFEILNNTNNWYYVLGDYLYTAWSGNGQWGYNDALNGIKNTKVTQVKNDTTGIMPIGSVLCLWCDAPGQTYESAKVYNLIKTMAEENPDYFKAKEEVPTEPELVIEKTKGDVTATKQENGSYLVKVKEGSTLTLKLANSTDDKIEWQTTDDTIATVKDGRVAFTGKAGTVTITAIPSVANDGDTEIKTYTITFEVQEAGVVEVTKEKTITVTVGGTATDVIDNEEDFSGVYETEDTSIATVESAVYAAGSTTKEMKEITDSNYKFESGKKYLIANVRKDGLLLTNTSGKWNSNNALILNGTASADSANYWFITPVNGGYTVKDANGKYLSISYNSSAVSDTETIFTIKRYTNTTYKAAYWDFAQNSSSYHLNQLGGDAFAGGYSESAKDDTGSCWQIYEITEKTDPSTTVTFKGVSVGTTYVTIGDTRYTIRVIEKKDSIEIPITIIDYRADGLLFDYNYNEESYAYGLVHVSTDNGSDSTAGTYGQTLDGSKYGTKIAGTTLERTAESTYSWNDNNKYDNSWSRMGLVEERLGENGMPVYTDATVQYVAGLISAGNHNDVSGNGNSIIYDTFIKTGAARSVIGKSTTTMSEAFSSSKTWDNITNAYDLAWYLLNTFYIPDTNMTNVIGTDGETHSVPIYGMGVDTYNKIILKAIDENGVYRFDAAQKKTNYDTTNAAIYEDDGAASDQFYPLENLGYEQPGLLTKTSVIDSSKNGNFALRGEAQFEYIESSNLYFKFQGDDDVYMFINGVLALDLGGAHGSNYKTVELNKLDKNKYGLKEGEVATFTFFYLERCSDASTFAIETNMGLVQRGIKAEKNGYDTSYNTTYTSGSVIENGTTVAYDLVVTNQGDMPMNQIKFEDTDNFGGSVSFGYGVESADINADANANFVMSAMSRFALFITDKSGNEVENTREEFTTLAELSAAVAKVSLNPNQSLHVRFLQAKATVDASKIASYTNTVKVTAVSGGQTLTDSAIHELYSYNAADTAKDYVVDFGLPLKIENMFDESSHEYFADKTKPLTLNNEKSSIKYGDLEISGAGPNTVLTYTLKEHTTIDAVETVVLDVSYKFDSTIINLQKVIRIIPASTVYYEDDLVTFVNSDGNTGVATAESANGTWYSVGKKSTDTDTDIYQALDKLGDAKANNYGYDPAYEKCSKYSLGSAVKVTVDSNISADSSPTAKFTFKGTGFDIISLTDYQSGAIYVDVYKGSTTEERVKGFFVNNYYGYKVVDGKWVVDENAKDALYQIPVMKVSGLDYGTYTVVINVRYYSYQDVQKAGEYSFWLDAIRIYDPAGTGDINNEYTKDDEGYPQYIKLRNELANGTATSKLVFIDGGNTANIATYANFGPNNEVYLAKGQAISFKLTGDLTNITSIQIGAKAPSGTAKMSVNGGEEKTIETATEMYYEISKGENDSITITNTNTGDGILSLTNLKITYSEKGTVSLTAMNEAEQTNAVMMVRTLFAPPAPVVFEPETFTVKLNYHDVYVREYVKVTVTTSDDVDYITVGDKKITRCTEERTWGGFRKGLVKTGKRIWSYYVSFNTAGQQVISVVAYDADGLASEAVDNTVNVKSRSSRRGRTSEWHV